MAVCRKGNSRRGGVVVMDDQNVQYPNRYKDKITGQVFDLEWMPGQVTKQGSAYNKANVLPDRVCNAYRLPITAEPRDGFLKGATAFRGTAVSTKNIAWLLAEMEIAGKVQDHTHIFYDVFYPSHTPKIGYIDNRYISVSGTLPAGTQSIESSRLNIANYPVNERYANPSWQEFTVTDGTKKEIIYAKETPVFNSSAHTGSYPATVVATETATYRVTLMGGKGLTQRAEGGNGGTVIVAVPVVAKDVLTIDKINGSGKGVQLKKNGITIAVAGGGGGSGHVFMEKEQQNVYSKGGDGGSDIADAGQGQASGQGAQGAIPGDGGRQERGQGDPGKAPPDGSGGNNVDMGAQGGGGYAGGGQGGEYAYTHIIMYVHGSGGGGSSYIAPGLTIIENSKGTNNGTEYALISKQSMELKTPLANSYTNAILYRSNLAINTTAHNAKFKKVNNISRATQEVRLLIRDYMDFIDFAVWLMVKNIKCLDARVSFGQNIAVDESAFSTIPVYESPTNPKEIHIDGDNKLDKCKYVAITLTVEVSDASEVLQLYGGIA